MSRKSDAPPPGCVRLVFIGDIVGKPGIRIVCDSVEYLRREYQTALIVANAENVADGSGIRCKDYRRFLEAGVDAMTLGDHAFRKREIFETLQSSDQIVRPANLPDEAPGKGTCVVKTKDGYRVAITSVLGRVFMKPIDCPFRAVDAELASVDSSVKLRLVDFHAEATSEMQLMGRHLDGKVSAVLGTHTHVATADEQILPSGTGFQSDVGMSGPFESILGRKIDAVMEATLNALPTPFQVATEDVRVSATMLDIQTASGKCVAIQRLQILQEPLAEYNRKHASPTPLL